ncbi:hypothetical protein GS911_22070 [Rhodococcus hoagii]|nr:hypothetical protein [Prescottella equi]
MRIDPGRTHDYATTSTMPTSAPDVPWAVYLAGTDHRYRLLAFDFDSGRHGADAARSTPIESPRTWPTLGSSTCAPTPDQPEDNTSG